MSPIHRVQDDADSLAAGIADAEANGEAVAQVLPWANELLIVTTTAARSPRAKKPADQRETRSGA